MFNVSLMLYEVGDIIDILDDAELIRQYKKYAREYSQDKLGELFNWFKSLSPEQLIKFRLEFKPRTKTLYESLCILTYDPRHINYLIVKYNPSVPIYRIG